MTGTTKRIQETCIHRWYSCHGKDGLVHMHQCSKCGMGLDVNSSPCDKAETRYSILPASYRFDLKTWKESDWNARVIRKTPYSKTKGDKDNQNG